jgi:hypothetical protein
VDFHSFESAAAGTSEQLEGVGIERPLLEFLAMPEQHYFFKLILLRPTLRRDKTDEDRRFMAEHGRYFRSTWRLAGFFCPVR